MHLASGYFKSHAADRVAVLPHKNQPAVVKHRQHGHRAGVLQKFSRGLLAVRQCYFVRPEGYGLAAVHADFFELFLNKVFAVFCKAF